MKTLQNVHPRITYNHVRVFHKINRTPFVGLVLVFLLLLMLTVFLVQIA